MAIPKPSGHQFPAPRQKLKALVHNLVTTRRSQTITDTSNIEAGFQTTINEHNDYMIDFKSKKEKDEAE